MRGLGSFTPLLVLLAMGCHATEDNQESSVPLESRIVGGTPLTIDQAPYMVQLRKDNNFICGGALISPLFVLSAAHCVFETAASRLTVIGGATTLEQSGVKRRVRLALHPSTFSLQTMYYDVSVLKLYAAMEGPNIATIALYNGPLTAGMNVRVSGWGKTSENANLPSNHLRSVVVPITRRRRCAYDYRQMLTLRNTMFCAGVPGRKDSCSGDSGGPVLHDGKVCGIVSFGKGCAERGYPGVYTSVPAVRNFIERSRSRCRSVFSSIIF